MKPETIKKLVVYNLIMVSFFLSTNISSFLGVILIIGIMLFPEILIESIPDLSKYQRGQSPIDQINKYYTSFIKKNLIEQIIIVLAIKLLMDVVWMFPSWQLAIIVVQYLALFDTLKDAGITDKLSRCLELTVSGVKKLNVLIPKFKQQ